MASYWVNLSTSSLLNLASNGSNAIFGWIFFYFVTSASQNHSNRRKLIKTFHVPTSNKNVSTKWALLTCQGCHHLGFTHDAMWITPLVVFLVLHVILTQISTSNNLFYISKLLYVTVISYFLHQFLLAPIKGLFFKLKYRANILYLF